MMTLQIIILYAGGFLVGISLGSFLGCAIYRVPRRIPLSQGRSTCPGCGHTLTARELVPVGAYLWQRGRARCCGTPLSPAYFRAELLCGLIGLAIVHFMVA